MTTKAHRFFSAALITSLAVITIGIVLGVVLNVPAQQRTFGRPGGQRPSRNQLTGTYRVDPSRSDDVWKAAEQATRALSDQDQQNIRERISRRLDAPEMLALERNGRSVTIASSRAPQVTFEADGSTRTEQTPRGKTVHVSATLLGDQLTVASSGDRGSDYRVTFVPMYNGRQLRVTRSLDIERLNQPVSVTSIYNRTSDVAQSDLYTPDPSFARDNGRDDRIGSPFPEGTRFVATLDSALSTKQARDGDRFTLTVQSPSEYSGAVIEGLVSRVNRSGRVAGRSELAMNFDRIRLRDGATQSFDGYIETVRNPNGDDVRVDNEGVISEQTSQSTRTAARTGIGAAVGALIGAVAGGGKGAAIGAAVGAGAGAGSVFAQGRDDLDLVAGAEFTIKAVGRSSREQPGQ